ncbi:MAG: 1-acyl-sn-glycerol-3-phosphate acyltransferase [Deltaproteobacteria bacterium]|jgi:1-acyl-sn-glycerol-3-phosphate acyltransferase|nr:1-acyl-sn-glycerol-3-phosphate acyltransferase [Deltaproteobacteria bacterium]
MLDLARLERLKLVRRPLSQRVFGQLLGLNYHWLPGVEIVWEDQERIPDTPVLFAMNHTDRYNYFPFQYELWQRLDRFTATWVKGKYYEHPLMAWFMESMLQLPTVSRGYLITRDFVSVLGRTPTDREYALLRTAVDARALGGEGRLPSPPDVPEKLLRKRRDPLGLAYDPERADYAEYICALFRAMMSRFVKLNARAVEIGLDLLVFPQGTRSKRLLPGHVGIAQMALHLQIPIVPIGCNGSDLVYPGGVPIGRRGRIVYRFGQPIPYGELAPFHIAEDFAPFTAVAERDHAECFEGVAALVTDRIDALLDDGYRRAVDAGSDAAQGSARFV